MGIHWYLVAHRSKAHLLEQKGVQKQVELVETIENPDGRLKDQELYSDKKGHVDSGQNDYERTTTASTQIAQAFARELSAKLDSVTKEKQFDTLTLVAAPQFLGMLRKELNSSVAQKIRAEHDKDLAGLPLTQLKKEMLPYLLEVEPL